MELSAVWGWGGQTELWARGGSIDTHRKCSDGESGTRRHRGGSQAGGYLLGFPSGGEDVLELNTGGGHTTQQIYSVTELMILKWFILHEFHLD